MANSGRRNGCVSSRDGGAGRSRGTSAAKPCGLFILWPRRSPSLCRLLRFLSFFFRPLPASVLISARPTTQLSEFHLRKKGKGKQPGRDSSLHSEICEEMAGGVTPARPRERVRRGARVQDGGRPCETASSGKAGRGGWHGTPWLGVERAASLEARPTLNLKRFFKKKPQCFLQHMTSKLLWKRLERIRIMMLSLG
jgi:hypothetical protein